jgi:hypothetical protein
VTLIKLLTSMTLPNCMMQFASACAVALLCHGTGALVQVGCKKIAEAEAVVSVNEKKWLVMHVMVQVGLNLFAMLFPADVHWSC